MRSVSPLVIAFLLGVSSACAPEGSSAYVSANLPLDSQCLANADSDVAIATGIWDVGFKSSASSASLPTRCVSSYHMNLLINSNLKANARDSTGRAEPNVLLITHADVRLMDKNQATLPFDKSRPNPYRVQTAAALQPTTTTAASSSYVEIEAIPKVYAESLANSAHDSILVEVQVFGTTTGDVDVEFRPFVYPLSLCRGCLSYCQTAFDAEDSTLSNLQTSDCNDNAAQDGRLCIDRGC